MPISLFKDGHQKFEDRCIPLVEAIECDFGFDEIRLPDMSQVKEASELLGINPLLLFVQGSKHMPYFYYHDHVMCNLRALQTDYLKHIEADVFIKTSHASMTQSLQTSDFERAFLRMNKRHLFDSYQELFDVIPDHLKFDVFIDAYQMSEYGFSQINQEAVKEVATYCAYSHVKQITRKKLKSKTQRGGFITLYRGAGDLSSPLNEAYSWTTDKKVALFFANRFGKGRLYRAKVHISNVLAYLTDRDESEVLVLPEDLIHFEELI
ncbi:hypothetical protein [Alicyclobacillus sp. SO9]|uniref:hypothetical protein n=1 Tax=Alicyclobacillus sp. SO9 TaxID=2665646 RepID=UPI0018E8462A|nr:hypothetical protein [Alicyclobacillus sp. SO9]QQE77273.1 hypothetical protein GI364_15035 [Alicyclobacillus sp. SO9]